MTNFYPGPSKLYPNVRNWLTEIYDSGILAQNHRSVAFMALLEETITLLKLKLAIPNNYEVYFTSSATECWEIVNQSLLKNKTLVAYNGAFGEKWHNYASKSIRSSNRTGLEVSNLVFNFDEEISFSQTAATICLTHNETSNGSCISDSNLIKLRKQHPASLIAVDATSSMAGVSLPWETADVWFASVQKCFGLPSGMAVMVVSPQAVLRGLELNESNFYNSFVNIRANFEKFQTPYTPNILGISLMHKLMNELPFISNIHKKTIERATEIYEFITNKTAFDLLVKAPSYRSNTVLALTSKNIDIQNIITKLNTQNITVGKGYGNWKHSTFRLANFPAISNEEFEILKNCLAKF